MKSLEERARQSAGSSSNVIHAVVEAVLHERGAGGVLADIGCGTGQLWARLRPRFSRCVAVDALRFDGLPQDVDFRRSDLDAAQLPVESGAVDVAVAVETIEHLENPRAFCRELVRIVRPGGTVVITTPNQLSLLSLLALLTKHQFAAFQDGLYPAHLTALVEIDLRRIASECDLTNVDVRYTCDGRIPLSAAHYPAALSRAFPRRLSDNVILAATKP